MTPKFIKTDDKIKYLTEPAKENKNQRIWFIAYKTISKNTDRKSTVRNNLIGFFFFLFVHVQECRNYVPNYHVLLLLYILYYHNF